MEVSSSSSQTCSCEIMYMEHTQAHVGRPKLRVRAIAVSWYRIYDSYRACTSSYVCVCVPCFVIRTRDRKNNKARVSAAAAGALTNPAAAAAARQLGAEASSKREL